jgi:hypothetical protein
MRDDRHAEAGSSHVASPAARDSSRISTFVRPIVGVVAVEHHVDGARRRQRRQCRVELLFAVVAAVDRIGAVLRAFELGGGHHFVPQRETVRHLAGQRSVMFGIARAVGGDAERTGAEDLRGDYRKIGAVDAAAEGDDGR